VFFFFFFKIMVFIDNIKKQKLKNSLLKSN